MTTTSVTTPSFITDTTGGIWCLVPTTTRGNQICHNGVVDTATANVVLLLYFNNTVYQEISAGNWWSWTNNAWVSIGGDPRKLTPSPSGTKVTTAGPSIIDSALNTWTLVSSTSSGLQVALNGTVQTLTGDVVLLLYYNRVIYQENNVGGWWSWTNGTWASSSNPQPTQVSITGISLSNSTVSTTAAAGTVVGTVAVSISSGSFTGTLALTGSSLFELVGTNVKTASAMSATNPGSYSITIAATQSGAGASPYSKEFSMTVTSSNVTTSTPPQAASAGYTTLAFSDDFTSQTIATTQMAASGYNWYWGWYMQGTGCTINTTATAASAGQGNGASSSGTGGYGGPNASSKGGILTLNTGTFPGGNIISVPGMSLNTGNPTYGGPAAVLPNLGAGNWQFCYIESYIQFVPNGVANANSWPAFWTWNVQSLMQVGFGGSSLAAPDPTEIDILESYGTHNFGNGADPAGTTDIGTIYNHGVSDSPLHDLYSYILSDSNWHTYGLLWTEGAGGQGGNISIWVDNIQKGSTFTYTNANLSLNSQSLMLIFGTGANGTTGAGWEMNVDWVRVWVTPGTNGTA